MELKLTEPVSTTTFIEPFNRTLWNWNSSTGGAFVQQNVLLIEPYGIEIPLPAGNY